MKIFQVYFICQQFHFGSDHLFGLLKGILIMQYSPSSNFDKYSWAYLEMWNEANRCLLNKKIFIIRYKTAC